MSGQPGCRAPGPGAAGDDRAGAPEEPGRTPGPGATIKVCPDGPLLVRGSFAVVDADGAPVGEPAASVALCRCGKTGTAPFCDGTHKVVRPRG